MLQAEKLRDSRYHYRELNSIADPVNGNKTDADGNNSTASVSQQRGNQHGNESALMETNQLQQSASNMETNQRDVG